MADVEMADASRSPAPPTARTVLEHIAEGQLNAIASLPAPYTSHGPGNTPESQEERDLLAPFLPTLTRIFSSRDPSAASKASSLASLLVNYDIVNDLREYTLAIRQLSFEDVETAADDTTTLPISRQFEAADPKLRSCIVLKLILSFSNGKLTKEALQEHELTRNAIYQPHLIAILVNLLANDALQRGKKAVTVSSIVAFCLVTPLSAELIEGIVMNDPSLVNDVLDCIVGTIATCDPLKPPLGSPTSSLLPFELRQALAACSTLAALSPSYASQIITRLSSETASVAAVFIAFQLIVETPSLRDPQQYSVFLYQWMKRAASASSPVALYSFLQQAQVKDSDTTVPPSSSGPDVANFLEESRYVLSQFRQFLVEDITSFQLHRPPQEAPGVDRFTLVLLLHVLAVLLSVGQLHPEDHETTQLLRLFDKVAKDIQPGKHAARYERVISLMYVLVLLLCAPSAPAFAKMPSQREDSTKLILQLAHQCIYSLYNTKAACPLFVLASVLLYTKSPSLLPFLSSFLGDTVPLAHIGSLVRVEYLHGVGDAILKPILTESVMAGEVLTAFAPVRHLSLWSQDAMNEMVLRSLHGLLAEKSFLRHHHARKLHDWITAQVGESQAPVHPLLVNILLEWVDNYVMAFEYPVAQRPLLQLAIVPLALSFLSRTLSHEALTKSYDAKTSGAWAKAALVLMYALQFNQRMRLASGVPGTKLYAFTSDGSESSEPPLRGGPDIILSYDLELYPVKQIVDQVARHSGLGQPFECIAPTLLRLVAEELPWVTTSSIHRQPAVEATSGFVWRRLVVVDDGASEAEAPVVAWLDACLWLRDLSLAATDKVNGAVDAMVECLLPVAVLSCGRQSTASSASPESFLTLFLELYQSRLRSESSDPAALARRLAEAICVPALVWRHYRAKYTGDKSNYSRASASWITVDQLVQQPFYVLHHAHGEVLTTSRSLLRLAITLTMNYRDRAIFHVRRRDASLASARRPIPATDPITPASTTTVAQPSLVVDPATQQMLTLQDCILVQSLLALARELNGRVARDPAADEATIDLYQAIDSLLASHTTTTTTSSATTLPPLVVLVHTQGYDLTLVASCVHRVPSLQQLWLYWVQPPSVPDTPAHKHNRSASSSSSTSNNNNNKAVDFLTDAATDKDVIKWQFRVRVFFALCARYFTTANTTTIVTAMKQIWNRLRTITVSSSSSSKGVLHAISIGDSSARVAFIDAVLQDAIDGCSPHGELRIELAQFLLSLKKHVSATSGAAAAVAIVNSPSDVERKSSRHHELERVVFRAYQRLVGEH